MSRDRSRWPWAPYLLSLMALSAGLLAPGGRVWGLNAWAYVPRELALALLGIGLAAPPLAVLLLPRLPAFVVRALPALALLLLAVSFWLLRTRAHFLGDGYQDLSLLAADHVRVKSTARGTMRVLIALRSAFAAAEDGALAAYRTLAIASGLAYLALVVFAARRLVEGTFERRGFIAILATTGAMVLFFGYVENYAPFVVLVTAHALHGVHVAKTGRTRWAAPAIVGGAIFFHVLGFALLPSLVWILASGTPLGHSVSRLGARLRVVGALGITLLALAILEKMKADHLVLAFALVPFTNTRFTLEGYTVLSPAHLLDLANLGFLLLPGVLVLAPAALAVRQRGPVPAFLVVLIGATSGTVFLLDPKLGMPRDWDVFAFAGIPWAVAGAWMWASAARRRPALRPAGPLAALLGALVLLPRLVILGSPEWAIPPFRAYLELDQKKGRNARVHLVNHYRDAGRDDLVEAEILAWGRDNPERGYLERGVAARNRGEVAEAVQWYTRALRESPQYFDAYNNLADCYLLQQRPDEAIALLKIAIAINPSEYGVLTNLGTAEFMRGDPEAARRYWAQALAVNPAGFHPNRNLARLAQQEKDPAGYERHLGRAAAAPDAPGEIVAEWGNVLAGHGRMDEALGAYREAFRRGLPEDVAVALQARFPEFRPRPAP